MCLLVFSSLWQIPGRNGQQRFQSMAGWLQCCGLREGWTSWQGSCAEAKRHITEERKHIWRHNSTGKTINLSNTHSQYPMFISLYLLIVIQLWTNWWIKILMKLMSLWSIYFLIHHHLWCQHMSLLEKHFMCILITLLY